MSATHRPHPDPERDDPEDAVLWDDCERCDEHAKNPGDGLDAAHLADLYTLAQSRTYNEQKASHRIGLAVRMTRIIDREIDRRRRRAEGRLMAAGAFRHRDNNQRP